MEVTNSLGQNNQLYFLGERNYVQAPVLLKFAISSICNQNKNSELSNYHLVRFKQADEVCRHVKLILRNDLLSSDTIKSQIDIKYAGSPESYCLVDSVGDIECRISSTPYFLFKIIMDKGQQPRATAKVPFSVDFWQLLSEIVELAKRLHESSYNNKQEKFRFVVGGFEKMDFFNIQKDNDIFINCTVAQHFRHGGDIYNQCRISITQNDTCHRFYLPFIGRSIL